MRDQTSLSGTWQFHVDPAGSLSPRSLKPDKAITVPMPWQVEFPDLATYSGYAWYRRTFDLPEAWLHGELLLRFGAVDYWCKVFVNGEPVGEHEGGYTPFEFAISGVARPGENEIAVQVYDSVQSGMDIERWPSPNAPIEQPGPPFNAQDVPHGKQEWYINVGGIWQDVDLLAVPRTYLDLAHVSTDIGSGQAHVRVELAGAPLEDRAGSLGLTLWAEGAEVGSTTIGLAAGQNIYEVGIAVENARLWSPEDPYLYTLTVTLQAAGSEDELSTRFGFREIRTDNGKILLNGEPIFLLCALDQDLYPDTIYTVPSEEYLRDQFAKAKHLGLNSLRCHIKPPDPRYLDLADEMGLLVWAEVPSWRTFHTKPLLFPDQVPVTGAMKRRVEQTLEEMVRRDFNHPSLIIWTIVNEDWGTSLPLSGEDRAWVAEMYERCKTLDPTRLVVDNSACPHPWGPNMHVHSDLDDFHMYANIPDQARNFEQAMDQFGLRPLWTYSTHGDATRTGHEPLVLSEFGNWGLPSVKALRKHYKGKDPEWFKIGAWWSPWEGLSGWAGGVEERFHEYGLDTVWEDYEAFAAATQWHQFSAMKFQIEAMRRQPALAGYVITEFTDAYWESNGLLDFARNPKAYYDEFASINAPDVIIPRVNSNACWDDQPLVVRPFAAHYSAADWEGARLQWSVEGTELGGAYTIPTVARGEVLRMGNQSLDLPRVSETRSVGVRFTLRGANDQELARNSVDIVVIPSALREAQYKERVIVITSRSQYPEDLADVDAHPPSVESGLVEPPAGAGLSFDDAAGPGRNVGLPTLKAAMSQLGYTITRRINEDSRVAVTNSPNAELLQWVRDGGNLLFLSDGPSPFFWSQNRSGAYSGSWITSFTWLRDKVHRRLKVENPLGLPFKHIMPRLTILGLPYSDKQVQPDFLSGLVSGWVHQPSVHTVQFRYGRGRVIMTTYAIENSIKLGDAVGAAMLHDLLEYLCSDECQPTLAANY